MHHLKQHGKARPQRIVRACCYSVLAVAIATALPATSALAQTSANEATVRFQIPAGDLSSALDRFSTQSGIQLLYRNDLVAGKRSKAVNGSFTAERALQRLLEGSGLVVERKDAETWVLKSAPKAAGGAAPATATPSATQEARVTQLPGVMVHGTRTLNMDIQRTADDIQPYVVFSREDIRNAGATSIADFLSTRLTMASQLAGAPGSSSAGGVGGAGDNISMINLRGLGSAQTLILIDGRRATARVSQFATIEQADLNGIPLNAVERIEVLPATASAIYGGSATGGVINVVLRRDYQGLETTLSYDSTFRGDGVRRRLDIAGGLSSGSGKTQLMLVGSWQDGSPVLHGGRGLLERGRAHILANNPSALLASYAPPMGATTNIRSAGGEALVLKPEWGGASLGAMQTFIPYGYAGVAADGAAGLLANAGTYNFDLPAIVREGRNQALLNEPEVKSINLNLRHQFTPRLDVYLDLTALDNAGKFVTNTANGQFTLSAMATANPFAQDIRITTPTFGIDLLHENTQKERRAILGAIYALPGDWKLSLDLTRGRSTLVQDSFASIGLTAAAAMAVSSGMDSEGSVFNVFRDTNVYPVDFSPWLTDSYYIDAPRILDTRDVAMRLAGSLPWSLPGGTPSLSLLLEHREEDAPASSLGNAATQIQIIYPERAQRIRSGYVELNAPIFSERNAMTGIRRLDLQVALRRDEYTQRSARTVTKMPGIPAPVPEWFSRDHASTDHIVALRYEPVQGLAVRASYGTGFLPASLVQMLPEVPRYETYYTPGVVELSDPRRGNELITYPFTRHGGGHPDLRPERSRSRTVGLVWTPHASGNVRVSADWVRTDKYDNIGNLGLDQLNIDAELLLPGFIVRGPASDGHEVGRITDIYVTATNVAMQKLEALDLAFDARQGTEIGVWGLRVLATRNLRSEYQLTPVTPLEDRMDWRVGALKWQGHAELSWERNDWRVQWVTRYTDGYCLMQRCNSGTPTVSQGSLRIPSQTYHDLGLRWRAPVSTSSWWAESEIQAGIRNVLNRKPPIDVSVGGNLYSPFGDPRGSSYYVSLTKRF